MNNILVLTLIVGPIALAALAWGAKGKARDYIIGLSAVFIAGLGIKLSVLDSFTLALPESMAFAGAALEILTIITVFWIGLRLKSFLIALLAFIQFAFALAGELAGHAAQGAEIAFQVDSLARIMVLVTTVIGSLIVIYAIGYMKIHEEHAPATAASTGRFFFLLIGFLGAMNGLVLADDLRWLSTFWEITTLCSFALIGHDGTEEARRNARRAILINSFGGAALSAGCFAAAHMGLASLSALTSAGGTRPFLTLLCFASLAVAGLTKSAQMPFQSWLLGAMVAPTPVSALLHSATMVNAGVYVILRLSPAFAGTTLAYFTALTGALTFAATSALAIGQSNGKKVLAYSTIANLGMIVVCAGLATPLAYAAALMILCFHAASKGLLFVCMGTIEQKIGGRDIEDMGNILHEMPFTTIVTVIGMASMLFPPFGMLLSKWMAIEASASSLSIVLLLVAGSAFTVTFWTKWIGRITTVAYHDSYPIEKMPVTKRFAMLLLVMIVVFVGIGTIPIFKYVITPVTLGTFQSVSTVAPHDFTLLRSAAEFAVWPFVIFLTTILIFSLRDAFRINPANVRPPFLCGENIEGSRKTYEFRSAMDKGEHAWMPSMYLKSIFNEEGITSWVNPVAWAIIAALFIRSIH